MFQALDIPSFPPPASILHRTHLHLHDMKWKIGKICKLPVDLISLHLRNYVSLHISSHSPAWDHSLAGSQQAGLKSSSRLQGKELSETPMFEIIKRIPRVSYRDNARTYEHIWLSRDLSTRLIASIQPNYHRLHKPHAKYKATLGNGWYHIYSQRFLISHGMAWEASVCMHVCSDPLRIISCSWQRASRAVEKLSCSAIAAHVHECTDLKMSTYT
jgi:hypothetical protein